jgi:hypothetical protein
MNGDVNMLTFEEKCKRLEAREGVLWVWGLTPTVEVKDSTLYLDLITRHLVEEVPDGDVWKLERRVPNSSSKEIIYVTRNGDKRLAFSYLVGAKIVKSLTRMVKRAVS